MQNLRNKLIAGGAVVILAAIGTVMNSHPALGQAVAGPTVTINPNQLPLPVAGSTTVSGTVAATQSGTWNVGINGTPNVHVATAITAPLLVLDISHSASQHVTIFCLEPCSTQGSYPNPYVVPAGQNLVLTSVDINSLYTSGGTSLLLETGSPAAFPVGIWNLPGDGFTHSFQYPSGLVFPAGFSFGFPNIVKNNATVILQGFLTAN